MKFFTNEMLNSGMDSISSSPYSILEDSAGIEVAALGAGAPINIDAFSKALASAAASFTPGAASFPAELGEASPVPTTPEHAAYVAHLAAQQAAQAQMSENQMRQFATILYQKYVMDMHYFNTKIQSLEAKLAELEKWKHGTLEQMRRLREDHRKLRSHLDPEAEAQLGLALPGASPSSGQTGCEGAFERGAWQASSSPRGTGGFDTSPLSIPVQVTLEPSPETPLPGASEDDAQSLRVSYHEQSGQELAKAIWRVKGLSNQLKAAGPGRAVVSPNFTMWQMEDLKLMINPVVEEPSGARARKDKEAFSKMVAHGPLFATLKLKVPNPPSCQLSYVLSMGQQRSEPIAFDFQRCAIHGYAGFDEWLKERNDDDSVTISVEVWRPAPDTEVAPVAASATCSQGVSAPSTPPPGLLPVSATSASVPGKGISSDGILYFIDTYQGKQSQKVQWKIGRFSSQLRSAMGRAVVSTAIEMWNLQDMRIMIEPDKTEKGPRSRREKELYQKRVSEGPLDGFLKLKIPDGPQEQLEFWVEVGEHVSGPHRHDFSEAAMFSWHEQGLDWIKEIQEDGSLTVAIRVAEPNGHSAALAASRD